MRALDVVRLTLPLAALAACSSDGERESPPAAPPVWPGLPVSVTVEQRGAAAVPGTDGALTVRIGDVTRGQVEVTLEEHAEPLLNARSLRPEDSASFPFRGERFTVRLEELHNALVGDERPPGAGGA